MARSQDEQIYDRYLDACLEGRLEDPAAFCARHPGGGAGLRVRIEALHRMLCEKSAKAAAPVADPAAPDDGLPFPRLGEFRLLRRLDRGGMGTVFLAEQESLGRPVALKVIRPELQDSATAVERFRREALAVARLNHPHIVEVYAMGEDQGVRFIAMELVPGRGLDEILAAGPPDPLLAARWTRDIARALQYAHDHGVIHRDIKPGNIRITPDDRALLLDFGIARDERWKGKTLTQAFTGSPAYAAPEQLKGGALDARADVYGLGATLYQCLTGRTAFQGDAMEQVFHRVLTANPVPPRRLRAGVPRDLEVVTLKALAKRPGDRYATAGAMAEDLDAVLGSRPIAARPPTPLARARHWARRHPAPAAALAVLALAAVVVPVLFHLQRKADARLALADARTELRLYQESRAATTELEGRLGDLQREVAAKYLTEEEDRLLEEHEAEMERLQRARQASFHRILELVERAEVLDPSLEGADDVRAALFLEKWDEARYARDHAATAFYRDLVAKHDPEGRHLPGMGRDVSFTFLTEPAGAEVYLFRYQRAHGENRLVPVPEGAEPPLPPGAFALRVRGGAGAVEDDDVITRVAGHPVRDTVLAADDAGEVRRGDRLVAIDGRPVKSPWDVEEAREPGRFELERGGRRFEVAAGPVRFVTPAALAAEGDVEAEVFHGGGMRTLRLPRGLDLRTTAAPAFLHPGCRLGRTPVGPLALEKAAFLFVVRAPGCETLRYAWDTRPGQTFEGNLELALLPRGATPDGFVACVTTEGRFWIMEREVTAAEYLAFLNDAGEPAGVPRDAKRVYWEKGPDGAYRLPAEWAPDWPAMGVSYEDAEAYARWKTARARAEGRAVVYALPTWAEWLRAAHGMAPRDFPFGNAYRPKFMKSNFARPRAWPEPVMRFPIDESPLGVYDMSGSAMEWLDDWADEAAGLKRLAGGSWARGTPKLFEVYGLRRAAPDQTDGDYGFRLVMRERG